jgi:cyclopropane-fatty-acyl-phospholipid synthase
MNLIAGAIYAAERTPLPDHLTLGGIGWLCGRTRRSLATSDERAEAAFAASMRDYPIATHTNDANQQHYELPAEFFRLVLGPWRKYSCCYYEDVDTSLAAAEEAALHQTCNHAGLADGQLVLELGCGWGSLSLHMAETYPASRILAVSNSHSQREFIAAQAQARGLSNLTVVTADMNRFAPEESGFDRIVSVEMFEHMSNWRALLARTRSWLGPDGRLFLHVFTHRARSYRFDHADPADWIAHHFFTGGLMPARDLPHRFPDLYAVEDEWHWSGTHYARTAADWLARFDRHGDEIARLFAAVYGPQAGLWLRRWRLFFLATRGLFGHAGGSEWGVGHYRLAPAGGR